jgi:hypothetical protein
MHEYVSLFDSANNSIIEIWAIFITVNTAVIGWVLSKKSIFSILHVLLGGVVYTMFVISLVQILDVRYEYRNSLLLDLKHVFEVNRENKGYPYTIKNDGQVVASHIAVYIHSKKTSYRLMSYSWFFIGWFVVLLVFFLDSKGQFHKNE